ncbi:MAG: amino acid adenylation domain-containing protein [Lachnospiraceae bacterium]|nr:amino acid adenylation domain-containing protein [Lachnospiraceae bacterium]
MNDVVKDIVTIPDKIRELAATIPDKTAIIGKDRILTYKSLDELSDRVSYGLIKACPNLPKESPIGLLLDRKSYVFPLEIGINRAGFSYIPMTDEYPEDRIVYCMENADSTVLITTYDILHSKPDLKIHDFKIIFVEEVISYEGEPAELPKLGMDQLTHIIYTSGSTGLPKGVKHTALSDAVHVNDFEKRNLFHVYYSDQKTTMSMTQISFVVAIFDYMSLYNGGTVVFPSEEDFRNIKQLSEKMLEYEVQSVFMTPSFLKTFMEVRSSRPPIAILDVLIFGGEKGNSQIVDDVFKINPTIQIVSGYGCTESNSGILRKIITAEDREFSAGELSFVASAFVVDENGNPIKDGGSGELWLSSPCISVGYQNLEENNRKSFITVDGKRYFKTGDIAFQDKKGNYHITGRKDDMVKYHGQRVELGEIENLILEIDGVKQCTVLMKNNKQEDFLVAFYTSSREFKVKELTDSLRKKLPAYMIPGVYINLDEMPLNSSKKIDRMKLMEMEVSFEGSDYVEAETDLEKYLCECFGKVLGVGKFSVTGDFFEYGGTSLSVSRLLSILEENGYSISYGDVNSNPRPRKLAVFLENSENAAKIPPMDRDKYPLTKTQLGIYLEGITGGSKETYTTQYMMEAEPGIDEIKLTEAVHKLFDAHPALKYKIQCGADNLPYMVMVPDEKIEVPVFEGKADDRIDFANRYMPVVKILDNLLFHFAVYKTEKCCYLLLKSHLIASDGTSLSLLISDLNRALKGDELVGEDCCIQQIGMYEKALIDSGAHDKAAEYYKKLFAKMDGLDSLMGDLNKPLTPGVSKNYRYEPKTLNTETVKEFCNRYQITESSFFMGAMAILLGKYLYSDHVSFSTVYSGRSLPVMNHTIGTLIKRIPVYGDLSENTDIITFLTAMSKQVFSNMSNDIYSFDEVLKECPVNEDVEFIYQGDLFTDNMGKAGGDPLLKSDSYFMEQYHTGMVTGCMSIQFFATNGLYNMTIEYRNERFSEEWIKAFADHLFIIARQLLLCKKVGDIVMMSDAEKAQLEAFNNTSYQMDFVPVHEQIAGFAKKSPDKKAVICRGKSLTFKELDKLSDLVALKLLEKGIGKDVPVGVLLERSVYAYVVENGILKAGGAFVPFIPEYPDERINFCMLDASIPLLITSGDISKARKGLNEDNYSILTLEDIFAVSSPDEISAQGLKAEYSHVQSGSSDLAYCIYTSGSTGHPKGVMIEHRNIANYVHRNEKSVEIMNYAKEGRVCLALAAFSFDVSVVEQFVPLCNGNTVVIATDEEIHDPDSLAKLITDNGVSGITCTPTYLLSLLGIPSSRKALEQVTFYDIGAEAFPAALFKALRDIRKDSVILNVYGPTECTMGCSADVVENPESITIGNPIANTSFYIYDKFGNELPVGIKGELIIAGDQVGRGYVNLPEKTAEAFFMYGLQKAYHSGDLCMWNPDGKVRIFGRIDNQIKLRGFRIELDEIEKVMSEFDGINSGAVKVIKTGSKEFLAGYYTCENEPDMDAYVEFMKDKLPEYMVPQIMRRVEEMPLMTNGKIDRKALPVPDISDLKAEYVAPENDIERSLCIAFAKALGMEEDAIGTEDDFAELGGDSLKAMAVLAYAKIEGLTAADIFQKRTPKKIAVSFGAKDREDLDEKEKQARSVPHKLSPMQVKMIDNQLYNPGSTMWSNTHFLLRFKKEIDADRLCDAVKTAIHNHPGLAVVFEYNDQCDLQQRYDPSILPELKVEDVSEDDVEKLAKNLVYPFRRILNSCLFRARVFRTDKNSYLFMDVHHLLMDGASLGVLLKDVTNAYLGRELQKDYYFALLEDADQVYVDGRREKDREYFEKVYGKNGENYHFIPRQDHKSNKNSQGENVKRFSFDREQLEKAEEYWGVSHSCMAIASALITLSFYEGVDNVMTNWIFNNRLSPESEHVVGMLIKNSPVGLDISKFGSIQEILLEVKRQVAEGIAHSAYDYFVGFDSAFNTDPMEVNLQIGINGSEIDELEPELIELDDPYMAAGERFEIELLENEFEDNGIDLEIEYISEIYDEESIIKFRDVYINTLESIVHMKVKKAGEISI